MLRESKPAAHDLSITSPMPYCSATTQHIGLGITHHAVCSNNLCQDC